MSGGDFEGARQAGATHFRTRWVLTPGGALRTPVEWPNGPKLAPQAGVPWVRYSMGAGPGRRAALGAPLFRRGGLVTVQVFTADGRGDGEATGLADLAGEVFREASVTTPGGYLRFGAPAIQAIGSDGAWFQVNMTVPFMRDWIKS